MAKLMHPPQAESDKSIPIAKPLISDEDKRAVMEVLDSGMLVAGRQVADFEQAFARYLGAREAVATSSGTSALQVALEAAGIGRGDAVVTTPFTFVATGNAILYVGARPVFVDVDPRSYNINPQAVADAVEREHARAILCVHLYGLACDMAALREVAHRTGGLLIEDCAQAHGAQYAGKKVGTFGQAGVFSFYPSKNMTTGEGGMIVTNDPALAERARVLVNVGQRGGAEYLYDAIGYNYRMTNMAGGVGPAPTNHLGRLNKAQRDNSPRDHPRHRLLPRVVAPRGAPGSFHVYNQYTVRVPQGRAQFLNYLSEHRIGRRVYYPHLVPQSPAHQQLGFRGSYPVAEPLTAERVSLPVHPGLSTEDVNRLLVVVAPLP